jgi:hypothetical protein
VVRVVILQKSVGRKNQYPCVLNDRETEEMAAAAVVVVEGIQSLVIDTRDMIDTSTSSKTSTTNISSSRGRGGGVQRMVVGITVVIIVKREGGDTLNITRIQINVGDIIIRMIEVGILRRIDHMLLSVVVVPAVAMKGIRISGRSILMYTVLSTIISSMMADFMKRLHISSNSSSRDRGIRKEAVLVSQQGGNPGIVEEVGGSRGERSIISNKRRR